MTEQKENIGIKSILELAPLILFFVGYFLLKDKSITLGGETYDGFIIITAIFIPVLVGCTILLWKLTGEISKMQVVTAVLVIVFGGLTLWFNDEKFIKIKPTIIYLLFSGVLGFGLLRGTSYLQLVMSKGIPMSDDKWMKLTRRLTFFFVCLAIANEIVWRTMSTDAWVIFKTIVLTVATFVFVSGQIYFLIKDELVPAEEKQDEDSSPRS